MSRILPLIPLLTTASLPIPLLIANSRLYCSDEAKNVGKICGNLVNETGDITLKPNSLSDFPVLTQYGIPLDKFSISSALHDIVKLNSLSEDYILTFKHYNDCLVQVLKSVSYEQLKKTLLNAMA
jgi:hypothetical protein